MKMIKRIIVACTLFFMITGLSSATRAATETPTQADLIATVKVESVHDGDTFTVKLENVDEKVRILGIDTPELSEKKKFHCLGPEIAQYMKDKIEGKEVKLTRDTKGKNRDSFGRLLRYVELDGKDIGAELLKMGYAQIYKSGVFTKKSAYVKLQATAKKNKIGVGRPVHRPLVARSRTPDRLLHAIRTHQNMSCRHAHKGEHQRQR
jgi:micrococcal nuclease